MTEMIGEGFEYEFLEARSNIKEVKLSQLNASLIGKHVLVKGQITGEESQKAIPISIKAECKICGNSITLDIKEKIKDVLLKGLNFWSACSCGNKIKPTDWKAEEYTDFSLIWIRDILDKNLNEQNIFKSRKVYLIHSQIPKSKTVQIKGEVILEPKTNNISILADSIEPLETEIEKFQVTNEDVTNFKIYFGNNKEVYHQLNPDVIQRNLAKRGLSLTLHSVPRIPDVEGIKIMRGTINSSFFGDSKTSKSQLGKDVTINSDFEGASYVAEYVSAETGGRTGFLYTIDSDNKTIIWGSLALNDLGFVIVDGLQAMSGEELGEFRESIENGQIIVRRSVSGNALARCRILSCFNPQKPMNQYIYKCQGILDTWIFKKTPDITRYDFFIPFSQKDVSPEEIANRKCNKRPIPTGVFTRHIHWAWSRKPEDISYTDTAISEIKSKTSELIKKYSFEILPIVHNGLRDVITRLSVAKACELHSTDEECKKVVVEPFHVKKACEFYEEVLEDLELENYKNDVEGNVALTKNDLVDISKDLGEIEFTILNEIKHETKSSTQLSQILNLSSKTVKEHYDKLKKHRLVETKTGVGIGLTVRGIKFVKWVQEDREIDTKNVTNKDNGNKKGDYFPSKNNLTYDSDELLIKEEKVS